MVVIGERLSFAAYDSENRRSVWSSDGTAAGTAKEYGLPIGPDGFPHATLFNMVDLLYSWVSSPSRFSSVLKTPNWSITSSSWNYGPSGFTAVNGDVFFAYDGDDSGAEIWRSDSGTGTPELAYDINPGAADSKPSSLMNIDDRLYFTADDSVHGREIWRFDPATGQANLVADIIPGADSVEPYLIHNSGSLVFFLAMADAEHGGELWVVPGTVAPDGAHKAYLPLVDAGDSPAR